MANPSIEDHARIDEYLTNPDFSARYEIRINAPAPVVYRCLLRSDFSELWLVRLLVTVRSGKRLPRSPLPCDLRQRLQGTGFVILAEGAGQELSSALRDDSGGPMAGAVPISLPTNFQSSLTSDTRRQHGTSGCARTRPKAPFFRPRQGSSAWVRQHYGNFGCTGVWSAPSQA